MNQCKGRAGNFVSARLLWRAVVTLLACACAGLSAAERPLLGGVDINSQLSSGALPVSVPSRIYIADFALHAEAVVESPARPVLGRLAERVGTPSAGDSAQQHADLIVAQMSEALIRQFSQLGLPATRWTPGLPVSTPGWLVQGLFTEVAEGNRIGRAVIGFGHHASRMDIQLQVSEMVAAAPSSPFLLLGTEKDPSKLPGAIVTRNPYVAAAKFVLDKQATQKDVEQTAQAIAEAVVQFRTQVGSSAAGR